MATAPLTASLTETLSKALNDKFYFGNILTKAQEVAALNPVFWGDSLESYAKSKFAVESDGTTNMGFTANGMNNWGIGSGLVPATLVFWVNLDAGSGGLIVDSTGGNSGFRILHQGTNVSARVLTDGSNFLTLATNDLGMSYGAWYMIALVYDGTSTTNSTTVYASNGSTMIETAVTAVQTGTFAGVGNADYNILNGSGGNIDGKLDQFIPFNKALSSTEITALYNSGNGVHHKDLVGTESYYSSIAAWYDFNTIPNFGRDYHGSLDLTEVSIDSSNAALGHIEGAAAGSDEVTRWTDRSASGFDVVQTTIADAATYVENGFGSKGSFRDGELDLDPEPFNFTGDFAVGCWFKQDELTQFRFPIGVWGSTGSRSFGIRNGSSGAGIQFAVSHDGSTQSNTAITDKPIVAGEWYFGFGWHENGVQIGFRMWDIAGNEIGVEQLDPHTTGVFNSTSPFRIGGHTNEWNGELGDVYVFDKLLTSQEQQKLIDYSRESAGYTV